MINLFSSIHIQIIVFLSLHILILIGLIDLMDFLKLRRKSVKRNLILVILSVILFSTVVSIPISKMKDIYMFFFVGKIYFVAILISGVVFWFLRILIKKKKLLELEGGPTKKYEGRVNVIVISFLSLIFLGIIPSAVIKPIMDLKYISKGVFLETNCETISQSIGNGRGYIFKRSVTVVDINMKDTIHLRFDFKENVYIGQRFRIKYLPNTKIGIVIEKL
jgi:hypothetical protein